MATREFGRLATSVGNQPEIFPINFHAGDGKIYFRTAAGDQTLGDRGQRPSSRSGRRTGTDGGWSVIAKGRAHILTGTREIAAADELPLRSWVPTLKYDVELAVDDGFPRIGSISARSRIGTGTNSGLAGGAVVGHAVAVLARHRAIAVPQRRHGQFSRPYTQ